MKKLNLRNKYNRAKQALQVASATLEEARIEMQLNCEHKNTTEIEYKHDPYGYNHTPPYRICADCGFAERGWGCGYQILVGEPNLVSAEPIGRIWPNHLFVVSIPWKRGKKPPRNKSEAYKMAVKGTFPPEYLENK